MAKKNQKRSKQNKTEKVRDLSPGTKAKNVKGGDDKHRGEIVIESFSWPSASRDSK